MTARELQGQSDEQLRLALADTEKHLFQLRFQSATDRLETPSEIAKAKKDIARIKTEQRRRELDKLTKLSDAELTQKITDYQAKTNGPGKRRIKRALVRLTTIQAGRTAAKGKRK
jgi:large subunit ribosomal protein L29